MTTSEFVSLVTVDVMMGAGEIRVEINVGDSMSVYVERKGKVNGGVEDVEVRYSRNEATFLYFFQLKYHVIHSLDLPHRGKGRSHTQSLTTLYIALSAIGSSNHLFGRIGA